MVGYRYPQYFFGLDSHEMSDLGTKCKQNEPLKEFICLSCAIQNSIR
jgi:hypothetical protein